MAFGIGDAISAGLKVLDKFIPDPEAKAKAEVELRAGLLAWDKGQMEINKAEAQHRSIFVAGWRPWIGWVAGVSLTLTYVLFPLIQFGFHMYGMRVEVPDVGAAEMMPLIMGMLGFGGLRTFEKMKGLTK